MSSPQQTSVPSKNIEPSQEQVPFQLQKFEHFHPLSPQAMRPGQALDSYGNVTLPQELPSRLREEELEKAKAVTISQDRLHSVALYPHTSLQQFPFSSDARLENQQFQGGDNKEISKESSSQSVNTISAPIKQEEKRDSLLKRKAAAPTRKSGVRKRRSCSRWTEEEDRKLIEAYIRNNGRNWTQIAREVGTGKTGDQCNQHWHRVLNPNICKRPWTVEDDQILIERVKELGESSWKRVSEAFQGKTDLQCRHRWLQLVKRRTNRPKKKAPHSTRRSSKESSSSNSSDGRRGLSEIGDDLEQLSAEEDPSFPHQQHGIIAQGDDGQLYYVIDGSMIGDTFAWHAPIGSTFEIPQTLPSQPFADEGSSCSFTIQQQQQQQVSSNPYQLYGYPSVNLPNNSLSDYTISPFGSDGSLQFQHVGAVEEPTAPIAEAALHEPGPSFPDDQVHQQQYQQYTPIESNYPAMFATSSSGDISSDKHSRLDETEEPVNLQ